MLITAVAEAIASEGVGAPVLNVLVANETDYTVSAMQPHGDIEASVAGVRNRDRDLAGQQFGGFLEMVREHQPDLAITPEYSMPWQVLSEALRGGTVPPQGKLWALGCESISYGELEALKTELAPNITVIYETLQPGDGRFLDPLAYIFLAPAREGNADPKTVMLVQFKTYPMGDNDHFEINGLQRGTRIYKFGSEHTLKLVSLICSDALNFLDQQAAAVYDRALILHLQLNQNPRNVTFRQYRDRLLRYSGDATEILCLNWAKDVVAWRDGQSTSWNNIAGSAWYLKLQNYDDRDETILGNHRRGLYYTWLEPLRTHSLFFNFEPAAYFLTASKVAHIGVPAPMSRRRGPQLTKTYAWNTDSGSWSEQASANDGFSSVVGESGNARAEVARIADANPLEAERVLALAAGRIGFVDWHGVRRLDSCGIDMSETIRRVTFCQDPDQSARDFRTRRLRRGGHLWDILNTHDLLPVALADFKNGFSLEWSKDAPHQNAKSSAGRRATVIYMGEECSDRQVEETARTAAEYLHRGQTNPKDSLAVRQRLAVWFRQNGQMKLLDPHRYVQIDQTGDTSEMDIGKTA